MFGECSAVRDIIKKIFKTVYIQRKNPLPDEESEVMILYPCRQRDCLAVDRTDHDNLLYNFNGYQNKLIAATTITV